MSPPWTMILMAGLSGSPLQSAGNEVTSLSSDERVVLFDTSAYPSEDGESWILDLHAWVHELEGSRARKGAFTAYLSRRHGLEVTAKNRARFDARVGLILADNERGKRLVVGAGRHRWKLGPTGPNGHVRGIATLPREEAEGLAVNGSVPVRVILPEGDGRRYEARVHLVRAEGLSIISDLDDTVKITQVTDRTRMLDRTFLREFEAVPDMARLYHRWVGAGASFHVVSSSPWHLYEPIQDFLDRSGFPARSMSLKSFRFKDRTFWNLLKKGTTTKPLQIDHLLTATYPRRRFILVGDSGEQDPEVYADFLRRHPGRIERVLIRNVTGARRDDERFAKLFEGLPLAKWQLFDEASEIEP